MTRPAGAFASTEWLGVVNEGEAMDKYTPEVIMAALAMTKNIALICACAWTVVTLYRLSNSWHCLWALLMLLFLSSAKFTRD